MRISVSLPCLALLVGTSTIARAEHEFSGDDRDESKATTGIAEMGVGLFTLPGAAICVEKALGCSKGDTSLSLSGWPLFRRGHWALGAGIMLGVISSADAPRNDPPDVPRSHTRTYYSFEVAGRYYVPFSEVLEGWIGVTSGLGVVNDTFKSERGMTETALVGPRGVTILTEGFAIGAGTGIAYAFAEHWRVGGGVRLESWFLPSTAERDPLGDEASLRGRVTAMELALTVGYRSRLVF